MQRDSVHADLCWAAWRSEHFMTVCGVWRRGYLLFQLYGSRRQGDLQPVVQAFLPRSICNIMFLEKALYHGVSLQRGSLLQTLESFMKVSGFLKPLSRCQTFCLCDNIWKFVYTKYFS